MYGMVLSSVGRLVQHHVWNKVRMYVRSTNREGTAAIKNHPDRFKGMLLLDDFEGEAAEINGENPWLNYALPNNYGERLTVLDKAASSILNLFRK